MSQRAHWSNNLGFILAAVGSAVGLGNIWRFSAMVYENGGSVFLIPYVIALLTIGIPLLILEYSLGHWRSGAAPKAFFDIDKKWEWLGWWAVSFSMFGVMAYYSVVLAWCLDYFLFAVQSLFSAAPLWSTDPNTFFFDDFLKLSKNVGDFGTFNTMSALSSVFIWFVCWFICYKGVSKGIEVANKIFMPLLFLLTLGLVIWTFFLDGSHIGYAAYLGKPDFQKLSNIDVWIAAYSQNFYTLSIGFGIMIAYASYLPKKTSIVKNAIMTGFLNHAYSLLTGFAVFGILGFMAAKKGVPIQDLVKSGMGLAFVAFPEAINSLPFGKMNFAFGVIFFFCLTIAGISSAVSIMECFIAAILDKFHFHRKHVVTIICIIGFILSLMFMNGSGLFFLDIFDHFILNYGLVTVGLLECIIIGWLFSNELLVKHILSISPSKGLKKKILKFFLSVFWIYSIRFVSPFILATILVLSIQKDLGTPYEGYPVKYILFMGVGVLVLNHLLGYIFSCLPWKKEPSEDYWDGA